MPSKNYILIIFVAIIIILVIGSISYYNLIKPDIELNMNNDAVIKERYNSDYNTLVSKAREYFDIQYQSYIKRPFDINDAASQITEDYNIRNIKISEISISKYPLRADIEYDYLKKIIKNGKVSETIEPNKNSILLFDKKNGRWTLATISWQIIPLLIICFILVISIISNFLIKKTSN